MGPRTGAKTTDFQIPENLPPGPLQALGGFCVEQCDAMPAEQPLGCVWRNHKGEVRIWHERGVVTGDAEGQTDEGHPLIIHNPHASYLTGWVDAKLMKAICADQMKKAGVEVHDLPGYLRVRQRGNLQIFTNYGPETASIPSSFAGALLLGSREVPASDIAILSAAD